MLILSNDDIQKIVSYPDMLAAIEKAYDIYENNAYYMPDRFHVDYKNKNLLYMPCFLDNVFGTKMLTLFPENMEKGLPILDGLMLLNDYETGRPLCLMDGKSVTALRTGAVGGVSIRHMTPETVSSVGLIGAGVQGFYQLLYACQVRKFKKAHVFDPFAKNMPDFIERLRKVLPAETEIVHCKDATELLAASDVVISATPATSPVLPNDPELLKGRHYVGIGSYKPQMREFPDALFPLLDKVYIDADIALEESGDLIQPIDAGILKKEQLHRFSSYLLHEKDKDAVKNRTTFFKSVGIAIFDVVAADILYRLAEEKNIGYTM